MENIPIEVLLSRNVKSLRKQLGWSQEYLAEKTGVSTPYITQIEVGKKTPSLSVVEKLAYAFGVEYKALFESTTTINSINSMEFEKHILESKIIASITEAIHKEFNNNDV